MAPTVSSEAAVNPIILACSGGFGRECRSWLMQYDPRANIIGFIDDDSKTDCLGPIQGHVPRPGVGYIIAHGDGSIRRSIGTTLRAAGARISSIRSPYATYGTEIPEDSGSIILGNASIANDCAIGEFVLFQGFSCVGHDVRIGDGSTIHAFAFVGGDATLGEGVTLYPHAVVLPGVTIGRYATIGAGSVVTRHVNEYETVFGSPAKVIARGKPSRQ